MRLLFLNIADTGALGEKSVKSLRRKYNRNNLFGEKDEVQSVQLLDCALLYKKTGKLDPHHPGVAAVRKWFGKHISKHDKIMIGMHGINGDTDHCHAHINDLVKSEPLFTHQELAGFIKALFPAVIKTSKPVRLALIMCYGGRSSAHTRNHETEIVQLNMADSFAAKLYSQLVPDLPFRMTARTGSIGFNELTGRAEVETEAGIVHQINYRKKREEFDACKLELEKLLVAHRTVHGHAAMSDYIKHKSYQQDQTQLGKVFKKYEAMDAELSDMRAVATSKEKYGKIIYTYQSKDTLFSISHQAAKTTRLLQQVPVTTQNTAVTPKV